MSNSQLSPVYTSNDSMEPPPTPSTGPSYISDNTGQLYTPSTDLAYTSDDTKDHYPLTPLLQYTPLVIPWDHYTHPLYWFSIHLWWHPGIITYTIFWIRIHFWLHPTPLDHHPHPPLVLYMPLITHWDRYPHPPLAQYTPLMTPWEHYLYHLDLDLYLFSEYAYSLNWSGNTRVPWFFHANASHIH